MAYKRTHKGKKAPPGMHFMPNGKLMKDSAHKKSGGVKKSKATSGRRKLDANKDGKITKADFKILRGRKKRK